MTKINEYKPGLSLIKKIKEVQSEYPQPTALGRLFGRSPVSPEALSWHKGIRGEIAIGNRLESLKALGYTVLHSVPIGEKESDIDHIVISPTGKIFTINTKHNPGAVIRVLDAAVYSNGHKTDYYRNSSYEKKRVEKKLNKHTGFQTSVYPVLAYVEIKALNIQKESDVKSVTEDKLIAYIKETEQSLPTSTFDLEPLYDSSFWTESETEEVNQDELFAWYNKFHKSVKKAYGRKTLIGAIGLLGALGGILFIAYSFVQSTGALG
jgi:hypothetical protein